MAVLFLVGCGQGRQDNKREAMQITCVNNLKQIGLSLKVWAGDHGDQMPFNVSTNAGGTLELCDRDKVGFDHNSFLHFQVASNEFYSPRVLICPQDRSKTAAMAWGDIGISNVTYLLRTGVKATNANSREILTVCPIDGNIIYYDGSVQEKK